MKIWELGYNSVSYIVTIQVNKSKSLSSLKKADLEKTEVFTCFNRGIRRVLYCNFSCLDSYLLPHFAKTDFVFYNIALLFEFNFTLYISL